MSSNTSEQNGADVQRKDRGVLCAKCEHLNICGRNECTRCGAHLYIACTDCGQRNERVRSRCTNCHRRLHHSIFERARKKAGHVVIQMNSLQVILFCIGIALAFLLILFFSHFEIPGLI